MTSSTQTPFRIAVAVDHDERATCVAHIEDQMRERFGCEPPPTTGLVFVARSDDGIIGSLVIQGSCDGDPLPIESHFMFEGSASPLDPVRHETVQATRWTSSKEGDASRMIVLATMQAAANLGKRYMVIEAKPYAVKRLAAFGMDFVELAGATLRMDAIAEAVGEAGLKYYTETPLPSLYLNDIAASLRANGIDPD